MSISIAGAPVSFGVFELTDPAALASLPSADRVCEVLHTAGYAGIDLGPVGFLGRGEDLTDRLRRWALPLAGGWVELPFSDDARFEAALADLDDALALFRAGAVDPMLPAPRPTLADAGDEMRKANPGGTGASLTGAAFARFAANVQTAADRVRGAGFEPTFHHHMGTYIETPAEIDALLDATDVGLTLDTGHLLLGGGDPADGWRRWGSRIDHVHLKDVDLAVLRAVQARAGGMVDVWRARAFVPLQEGDLAIARMIDEIEASGYAGWLVVEQDVLPSATTRVETLEADQVTNIDRLRRLLDRSA